MDNDLKEFIDNAFQTHGDKIVQDFKKYGVIIEGLYDFSPSMIKCTEYLAEKLRVYLNGDYNLNCDFSGIYQLKNYHGEWDYFYFVYELDLDIDPELLGEDPRKKALRNSMILREKYLGRFQKGGRLYGVTETTDKFS